MVEVIGKGCVVRVLAHSISQAGIPLISYEIQVSRIVWAEFLTHGMLCRNAHSSRAIPFDKMLEQLTGKPVRFGQANKGMQDKGEDFDALVELWVEPAYRGDQGHYDLFPPEDAWEMAKDSAVVFSKAFKEAGYAKQVYNRLTETFQTIKAVVSATELANFFWLRDDVAADPTLHDLAKAMREAYEQSVPELLQPGEYHLPYVSTFRNAYGVRYYGDKSGETFQFYKLADAIKVSAARCAAVSFRNEDYGLEKCLEVYDRLVGDVRKHASAFQHQATPQQETIKDGYGAYIEVNDPRYSGTWEPGISHADRNGQLWSAQYRGWIMNRKLIPGENYEGKSE